MSDTSPDDMITSPDDLITSPDDMITSPDTSPDDARGRRPPDPRRRSPHAAAVAVARRTRPGARRQYLAARAKAVEAARRRTIDKTNN